MCAVCTAVHRASHFLLWKLIWLFARGAFYEMKFHTWLGGCCAAMPILGFHSKKANKFFLRGNIFFHLLDDVTTSGRRKLYRRARASDGTLSELCRVRKMKNSRPNGRQPPTRLQLTNVNMHQELPKTTAIFS